MDDLRQMQLMLTNMLKCFHEYCIQNSLTYYAVYGTALGAARHHGFIPWDDDLDVAMPRSDYEHFLTNFNRKNSNNRYILESFDSPDPSFLYPYSKLYDTQTTLIERVRKPLKRGIFIDIFPIDGAGAQEMDSKRLFRKIRRILFIKAMRTTTISSTRNFYKNLVLFFFQAVPVFIFHDKAVCKTINSLCKTFDYDSSQYVAFYIGWGKRLILHKDIFGTPILHDFENIAICCPEKMDTYLTHVYGDWKTPPPKEKQISHHNYYLDLTKSYFDCK